MCCTIIGWNANAQQRSVTGKVTDKGDGSVLPGVSVLVKGTSSGTVSDSDGNYSLSTNTSDLLIFSFIGFESQEIAVGDRTVIDLAMNPSVKELGEVVVIGYGERDKKDLTGAISSLGADQITKSNSFMTPELAMQGRMAGVLVSTPSGNPFDRPNIQIRGVGTFGYSQPLYVIDGIPVIEGGQGSGDAGLQDSRSPINIMTSINPNDIESISVLKDASSAAIYGMRASNGVILITTKRGKSGKPKVEISAQTGIQNVTNTFNTLNTQQYTALYTEAYANANQSANLPAQLKPGNAAFLGNSPTYDWQNRLLNKNAPTQDFSIRVSGGNDATTYSVSTGYSKTFGSLIENSLDRYSLSTAVTSKVSKIIETGIDLKVSYNNAVNNTGTDLAYVTTAAPWQPILDANDPTGYAASASGTFEPNKDFDLSKLSPGPKFNFVGGSANLLWGPATRGNVFATQNLGSSTYGMLRTLGNSYLQIEPIKGLKVKGSVSIDYYGNLRKSWGNIDAWRFSQTPGNPYSNNDGTSVGNYGERDSRNYNFIKQLSINYNKSIGDHNIDILLNAMSQTQTWTISDIGTGQINFSDPNQRVIYNTPPFTQGFTRRYPQALQGYFARVGYKFKDKYYLDATVRRDAASTFDPANRWGTFPSVSAAWRISSEDFFKNLNANFISDLKLRGGWGQLGNKETVSPEVFAYLSTLSTSPDYALGSGSGNGIGVTRIGAAFPNFANKSLSWERVTTTNIGFDATLFNDKVTFTAEYYSRNTNGIIQNIGLPPNSGIQGTIAQNVGNVKNSGFEFQLGYTAKVSEVNFNISGNFTTVKNEVLSLYGGQPIFTSGGRTEVGKPIGFIYGYKVDGIFQNAAEIAAWKSAGYTDNVGNGNPQPGDIRFQDINGNPDPGQILNPVADKKVNFNDQTYLGKTIPGYYYGLSFGANWKGLDATIFFQGVGDVQKYNWARAGGENMSSTGTNQWTSTADRWRIDNPSTTMPRAVFQDPNSNNRTSDRFVESSAFLRLKNMQIGYTVPASLLKKTGAIQKVRFFVSATNLLTVTSFKGIDPENSFVPPTQQLLVGLNATF